MGERLSGGGLPGRRRVHPGDAGPGSGPADDAAGVEALLAAAMRGDGVDTEAEGRAVAAFRAARDAGEHRARVRTRRRDDWRPREQRRGARSVKATLSVLVASLTLGGVAFAAIGTGGSSDHGSGDRGGRTEQTTAAPGTSGGRPTASGSPTDSGRPDHPATAQDTAAHCRAYEQVGGRGKALESTAWRRLVEAAGGEEKVADYCDRQLAAESATRKPTKTGKPGGDAPGAGKGDGKGAGGGTGQNADNADNNASTDNNANTDNSANTDNNANTDNADNSVNGTSGQDGDTGKQKVDESKVQGDQGDGGKERGQ
ncbi:hypothetical protein [Streptomyces griseus]|uniref:hypothetical protein n=1 Tax=Streptomyces griseus TaxID=1911 RepID=UPI0007C73E51|nr:hypothetical protein [Streptomyces griseus]